MHCSLEWLLTGEESASGASGETDVELLRNVIEAIEKALTRKRLVMKPAEKARFISLMYERFAAEPAETREPERILKLVWSAV